jgi:hypothetical protein
MTFAGYILGFPADTAETIRRDIAIIQKELPLDALEFFCLTPLRARRTTKSFGTKVLRWIQTSTDTTWSTYAPPIPK